jgi:hypothetical protein
MQFIVFFLNYEILFILSVPTGNNTHDNERQHKIKMLERLKFHITKQMPQSSSDIPVRYLIYFN